MRILLVGRSGFDYNRVRVLLSGLEQVAPGNFEIFQFERRNRETGQALADRAKAFDVLYVPPFRRRDVPFVRKHCPQMPVLFDPLIGSYITRVVDFGWWWRRPYARWLDRRDFLAAQQVLFDTEAHRTWAIRTLGLPAERTHVLYIGADTQEFRPVQKERRQDQPVRVGFYGSFVPLQGVERVIEAAYLLRHRSDIVVEIIGNPDDVPAIAKVRDRCADAAIEYVPYLPFDELLQHLHTFDICLGIFGPSEKANVVIPNKVYHYAALGKPFITRATTGIQEQFEHGESAWLVDGSPTSIASGIERLVDDVHLSAKLGAGAAHVIADRLTERHVARRLLALARHAMETRVP